MRKLVVSSPRGEREIPLTENVFVGRDPACAIRDDDPQLSRRHAEFVAGRDGVVVRDLNSRNGIRVNDVRTREAVLRSGDVIQVVGLRIRFVDDTPAAAVAPAAGDVPAAPAPEGDEDDRTRVVAMGPAVAARTPAGAGGADAAPVAETPAPPRREAAPDDGDHTRVLPLPAPPARPRLPGAAAPREPVAREVGPAARPAGTAALRGRGGWSLRLVLAVILLAVAVYTVTALLTLSWSERRADAIAEARAVALGQWLATEASLAIRTGGDVGQAVTRLARESGVKDAVIIRPEDGRIMAPSSRANESVDKLPGLGVAPAEVWRSQAVREGGLVEVVTPVATPGGPRGAVAWLRFQPSAADGGSSLVVLVPALLLAFGLALGVATVIRRNTERSLAAFNEDVELAVSGRLNQVADPMGVKPLKDLAETLNYLLVRVRGSERGGARPGSPPGRMGRDMSADPPAGLAEDRPMVTAERPGAPRPPVPAPRGVGGEATGKLDRPHEAQPGGLGRPVPPAASGPPAAAVPPAPARALPPAVRMVASAAYRVTEVGPECAGILDVRPEAMVGQHLLDAVPDKRVVDAVLRCLSTLPPAGEERTTVELAGKDYQLDVAVRRAGRDQPITIVLTPTESRVP